MEVRSLVAEEKTLKSAGRSSDVGSELGSLCSAALHLLVRCSSSDENENSSFFKRPLPMGDVVLGSSLVPDGYLDADEEEGVDVFERFMEPD